MKFKFSSEKAYNLLLIWIWSANFIVRYIRAIVLKLPIINPIADWIIPCVMFILVIISGEYIAKKIKYHDVLFGLLMGIIYISNILLFDNNSEALISYSYEFWLSVFPMYFVGISLSDKKVLKMFYYTSLVNIAAYFVYSIIFGKAMTEQQVLYSGNMWLAYALLPHIMMIAIHMFDKQKKNFVLFLFLFVYLILCGTRGAGVCLVIFLLTYSVLCLNAPKKLHVYTVIGMGTLPLIIFYEKVLRWLTNIAESFGMSVRIMSLLAIDAFDSTGRDTIIKQLWTAIGEKPILGYGLAGDMGLIGQYSHNFAIEMWVSFGVFIGSAVIITTFWVLIQGYRKALNTETKKIILLLTCSSFLKLFWSGTFFNEDLLFLLLGICVSQIRLEKENEGER